MNLVTEISSKLGLDETRSKGLAGGLLGLVQSALSEQAGPEAAKQMEEQLPEAATWRVEGDTPDGEAGLGDLLGSLGGGLGGLVSSGGADALGGLLGNSGAAGLAAAGLQLATKFGLGSGQLQSLLPLVTQFLSSRLSGDLLTKVQPLLGALGGGSGSSEVGGGLLGGLLS